MRDGGKQLVTIAESYRRKNSAEVGDKMQAAFLFGVTMMPSGQMPDSQILDVATIGKGAEAFLDVFKVKGAQQNLGLNGATAIVLPPPAISVPACIEATAGTTALTQQAKPLENITAVVSPTDQAFPTIHFPANHFPGNYSPGGHFPATPEKSLISDEVNPEFLPSDLIQLAIVSTNSPELIFAPPAAMLLHQATPDAPKETVKASTDLPEPQPQPPSTETPDLIVSAAAMPVLVPDRFSQVISPLVNLSQPTDREVGFSLSEQPTPEITETTAQSTPLRLVAEIPASVVSTSIQTLSNPVKSERNNTSPALAADIKVPVLRGLAFTQTAMRKPNADLFPPKVEGPTPLTQGAEPVVTARMHKAPQSVGLDYLFQPNARPAEVRPTSVLTEESADFKPLAKPATPTRHLINNTLPVLPAEGRATSVSVETSADLKPQAKPATPTRLLTNDNQLLPSAEVRATSVSIETNADLRPQAKPAAPTRRLTNDTLPVPLPDLISTKEREFSKVDIAVAAPATNVASEIELPAIQSSIVFQPLEANFKEVKERPAAVENAFHLRVDLENFQAIIPETAPSLADEKSTPVSVLHNIAPLPSYSPIQFEADAQQIEMPAKPVHNQSAPRHDPNPNPGRSIETRTDPSTENAPEPALALSLTEIDHAITNVVAANLAANPVVAPISVAVPLTTEAIPARHLYAPSPMQQTAAILANQNPSQAGSIEFTLTPEALGRLHFEMQPEGDAMAITLSAERPETLDLMRRHLSDLVSELKQAGIQAGTLSFGTWAEGRNSPPPPPQPPDEAANFDATPNRTPPTPTRPVLAAVGGLDLRI